MFSGEATGSSASQRTSPILRNLVVHCTKAYHPILPYMNPTQVLLPVVSSVLIYSQLHRVFEVVSSLSKFRFYSFHMSQQSDLSNNIWCGHKITKLFVL